MIKQHLSLASPRYAATTNRHVEQLLAGLLVVALGTMIFRAILNASDDTMLAFVGTVLSFVLAASLFAGDAGRRR